MTIAFISSSDCGRHDTGWGHPEHVGRLRAITRALRDDYELLGRVKHVESRHATAEEQLELPLLRSSSEPEQLRQLAEMVRTAEAMAPTHPHPHGPDGALGNLVVGPFVAVADRVRDALRPNR